MSEDQECLNTMHRARLLHVDRLDYLGTESCRTCWCVQNPLCRLDSVCELSLLRSLFLCFHSSSHGLHAPGPSIGTQTRCSLRSMCRGQTMDKTWNDHKQAWNPVRGVNSPLVHKPLAAGKRFLSKTNHQTLPTLILFYL